MFTPKSLLTTSLLQDQHPHVFAQVFGTAGAAIGFFAVALALVWLADRWRQRRQFEDARQRLNRLLIYEYQWFALMLVWQLRQVRNNAEVRAEQLQELLPPDDRRLVTFDTQLLRPLVVRLLDEQYPDATFLQEKQEELKQLQGRMSMVTWEHWKDGDLWYELEATIRQAARDVERWSSLEGCPSMAEMLSGPATDMYREGTDELNEPEAAP